MTISNLDIPATNFANAQQDMRFAYYGGAPGMLISALVWFGAGMVSMLISPSRAIWVLFIGGMFIHPASMLFCRLIGRSGKHAPGNPLGTLALASTFWLIFSLPLAYAVSLVRIEWFFPAMMLVIGGRYLTFSTIFGTRIYWACGMALALASYALAASHATPQIGTFCGAAIEAAFAVAIFIITSRETAAPTFMAQEKTN
ncbi:DUF7010 family protein [Undibacterium sp.]|uniref:DUF7010 family protein n=1 Tax=Undibacterium sp. TaxID=1914977 RepID=UPI00374CE805